MPGIGIENLGRTLRITLMVAFLLETLWLLVIAANTEHSMFDIEETLATKLNRRWCYVVEPKNVSVMV